MAGPVGHLAPYSLAGNFKSILCMHLGYYNYITNHWNASTYCHCTYRIIITLKPHVGFNKLLELNVMMTMSNY